MIPVTQPFLPPLNEYYAQISELWQTKWITNNGVFVQRLENEIAKYLQLEHINYVTNGTLALQIALKALNVSGEVITTPFSFVATTNSLIWENCKPVFVDIDPLSLCLDASKIESAISSKTQAILATHVFGIPCDVEQIENIANKYNLKVIYDGAHAFGVKYKGKSIFQYGDISTLSFHATKNFHTIEGGGIVCNGKKELSKDVLLLRSFGFMDQDHILAGINAKNSEFHAAMGICNLKYVDDNLLKRKNIFGFYNNQLNKEIQVIKKLKEVDYNYSYYPVLFKNEKILLGIKQLLKNHQIDSRRYFYPSLNKLPYLIDRIDCPISESIASRILCLPLYPDLTLASVERICELINRYLEKVD